MGEDRLSPQSLQWALNHLGRYGMSDFVPRAFELEALPYGADWIGSPSPHFDLANKRLRQFRRLLVPRPTGGYRLTTELDPLDALTFAAIAFEIAPAVGAFSVRPGKTGSMSGRVRISPDGDLFARESWQAFSESSRQFCSLVPQYKFIVFADISDFYGQVEFSTLKKKLLRATVPEARAENIVQLLNQCSRHDGRGMPQGPILSRLLAELLLAEADKFLAGQFVPFLRYADDFRIFAESSDRADKLLYGLSRMLLDEYGFTLSAPKTQIVSAEKNRGFPVTPEEAGPAVATPEAKPDKGNWWNMFLPGKDVAPAVSPLDVDPLPIQEARAALSSGASSHPQSLTDAVFRNVPRLAPIMRDVVDYLATDITGQLSDGQQELFRDFTRSASMDVPFIRLVSISLLLARDLLPADEVFQLAVDGIPDLGLRPALETAHRFGKNDWLAAQLEQCSALDPWDRRGLLFWSRGLPPDARAKSLAQAAEVKDPLDDMVVLLAEAKAKHEAETQPAVPRVYKAMAPGY